MSNAPRCPGSTSIRTVPTDSLLSVWTTASAAYAPASVATTTSDQDDGPSQHASPGYEPHDKLRLTTCASEPRSWPSRCSLVALAVHAAPAQAVVGGTSTPITSWPWMTQLVLHQDGKKTTFCGGTLVAPRVVLTAAPLPRGRRAATRARSSGARRSREARSPTAGSSASRCPTSAARASSSTSRCSGCRRTCRSPRSRWAIPRRRRRPPGQPAVVLGLGDHRERRPAREPGCGWAPRSSARSTAAAAPTRTGSASRPSTRRSTSARARRRRAARAAATAAGRW